MSKAKVKKVIQEITKINFQNRKRPELARATSKEKLDEFLEDEGISREQMIDKYQSELEDDPEQTHLLTFIEMLKSYV